MTPEEKEVIEAAVEWWNHVWPWDQCPDRKEIDIVKRLDKAVEVYMENKDGSSTSKS